MSIVDQYIREVVDDAILGNTGNVLETVPAIHQVQFCVDQHTKSRETFSQMSDQERQEATARLHEMWYGIGETGG